MLRASSDHYNTRYRLFEYSVPELNAFADRYRVTKRYNSFTFIIEFHRSTLIKSLELRVLLRFLIRIYYG